jgi:hypothetical protein
MLSYGLSNSCAFPNWLIQAGLTPLWMAGGLPAEFLLSVRFAECRACARSDTHWFGTNPRTDVLMDTSMVM